MFLTEGAGGSVYLLLVLLYSVAVILCSCFYSSAGPLQLILLLSQAWMAEVWEAVEELEDLKDLRYRQEMERD